MVCFFCCFSTIQLRLVILSLGYSNTHHSPLSLPSTNMDTCLVGKELNITANPTISNPVLSSSNNKYVLLGRLAKHNTRTNVCSTHRHSDRLHKRCFRIPCPVNMASQPHLAKSVIPLSIAHTRTSLRRTIYHVPLIHTAPPQVRLPDNVHRALREELLDQKSHSMLCSLHQRIQVGRYLDHEST